MFMLVDFFVRLTHSIENLKHDSWLKWNSRKQLKELATELKLVKFSQEQKKSIRNYYKTLGVNKVNWRWHQFYYSLNGIFNDAYISPYVFSSVIEPKLYDKRIVKAYDDKNFYDTLFPDIKQPRKILKCVNGYYYIEGKNISEQEALKHCHNIEAAIIKPSLFSDGGKGVKFLKVTDGISSLDNRSLKDVFKIYGKNFVIEEFVQQHPDLALLNASSCNTLRVMTYHKEQEVFLLVSIIRIGKPNSVIDNFSDSGLVCKIDMNGNLCEWGYAKHPLAKTNITPGGVLFKDIRIPSYDAIVDTVKKAHLKLPHFPVIGWDVTVNTNNEVVLIEFNAPCDIIISQFVDGRAFGDYTEEILKKAYEA